MKTVSETNIYRENLVVLDNENHLYHVVVKGLHVRDGKEVNTQVWAVGTRELYVHFPLYRTSSFGNVVIFRKSCHFIDNIKI
jgi:hypothetical protein